MRGAATTVLVVSLVVSVSFAQNRVGDEAKILTAVEQRLPDAHTFLERVVNIPSATTNLAGVRDAGRVFAAELQDLGFAVRWEDPPASMNRAGHLIAERQGTLGKRLLLLGHLDTILEGVPFERKGAVATGSGVLDMKGGDVVMLFALKALDAAGVLDRRRIIVILTGDEESPGEPVSDSRRSMLAAAEKSDVALSFENAVGNTGTISRRGASTWTLEVSGSTGHSFGIFGPDRGSGALFEAGRILNRFHDAFRNEKYLTVNPSVVVGGTDVNVDGFGGSATGPSNVVAQKVVVKGDLRFISESQKEATRAKMRDIVASNLPRTSATLDFQDLYPAMAPSPGSTVLLRQLDEVSRQIGEGRLEALDPGSRGAGDISFVASRLPALDGLGLAGRGAHEPNESAELSTMSRQIKRAALLIYRLTR